MNTSKEELKAQIENGMLNLPCTVVLKTPIELTATKTISEMTINRELNAGDIDLMPLEHHTMGDFYMPIASLTKQPVEVIRRLKKRDLTPFVEIVNYFLADGETQMIAEK